MIQFLNFLIQVLKRKWLKETEVHDFFVSITWIISLKFKIVVKNDRMGLVIPIPIDLWQRFKVNTKLGESFRSCV